VLFRSLIGAGYIEINPGGARVPTYIRRCDRARGWMNRLHVRTRAWLDFFGALDPLDKLAGL